MSDSFLITETSDLMDELLKENNDLMNKNIQLSLTIKGLDKVVDGLMKTGHDLRKNRDSLKLEIERLKTIVLDWKS